ncbi:M28 family peptidase [Robiginitalea sp. SC105]|uniref:M28 family peptidase n=1 Tax=Robiginitalea sp. SC105 TaxID=2762332 RepID=UPI00163B6076|nr:M28 family peptidase [Robiginitalea sp. SC105]MBC2838173.1 M28 family peptidase [Robiginitalea sp. SC105]
MKYNKVFAGILLSGMLLGAAGCRKSPAPEVSMQEDVNLLASDSLAGRETGTEGARIAAEYLADRMEGLGLQPAGLDGGYYQSFSFRPRTDPHGEVAFGDTSDSSVTAMNVLGLLDNQGERTVVIGAHYDHLGMGGEGSLHRGDPDIHNGADDNASGVAVMLRLARELAAREPAAATGSRDNYLFIAFSGEEMGLLGSNYFAKNPNIDLGEVPYMVNLDMVGRLRPDSTLSISGTGTSPVWNQILRSQNPGFKLVLQESGVGPSDHTSFYLQDIPVLHFFTGQHPDYHRPSDDADKLNYEGMEQIAGYILDLTAAMEKQREVAFRKTKNESEEVPRFKVGLGVVPDYLFDGTGMRIDGVSEDKPAQRAGLQKGDVVVQLGDSTITDMMSYMRALSSFEPGDSTTVVMERSGKRVTAEIGF